jgi:hypothetical protein
MPDFVEFSREDTRGRREEPMFTLQASGLLSFNHAAFVVLGEPAAVALLYDAGERVVGVREVGNDHQNAYPVRRQGQSMTYLVSAQGFVAHHEIPKVKARRFLGHDYGDGVWGFALREGDSVKNRRGAREPGPASTDRWRPTTNGFDVPAMMQISNVSMPDPSTRPRLPYEIPPTMRVGAVVACDSLGSGMPTSELRTRFLRLLGRPPITALVSRLTDLPQGATWRALAGRGRIYLEAALTGDDEDAAPAASASLLLPDPSVSGYGHDPRYVRFVLEVELRDAHGNPAPAMPLAVLHDRFTRALSTATALTVFLTKDLGLATSDDPPPQMGIWLKTPRDMSELVDLQGLMTLRGSSQSNLFTGWVLADPTGEPTAVTAVELLRQMCDYTLNLDGYEPVLEEIMAGQPLTLLGMDRRGWGWSASEIRRAHLAEWLAQQETEGYCYVTEFYDSLEDQRMNTWEMAHGDLKVLQKQSLINLTVAMGGIPALHVQVSPGLRDMVEDWHSERANRGMRRTACRNAMVDWLYSLDAVGPMKAPATQAMLEDPRHGIWFAEPFAADDLDAAAGWLHRNGLVEGPKVDQAEGPVRLYLTDVGVACAEHFESDAGSYVNAQQRPGTGPAVYISGGNSGPFQVAGDRAHQEQRVSNSANDLRKMITSIADLITVVAPDSANDAAREKAIALAAARDGAVDRGALKRFAEWVLSVVGKGATAALMPAVTAATNDMLNEAGRLTGHL